MGLSFPFGFGFGSQNNQSSPTNVRGLTAWYDASNPMAVTKDGSNLISQINDLSGNGYHGTAATTARPTLIPSGINSRACMLFDGVANAMNINGIASLHNGTNLPLTIIIVVKHTATAGDQDYVSLEDSGNYSGGRFLFQDSGGVVYGARRNNASTQKFITGGAISTTASVVSLVNSGLTGSLYVNGALSGTANQDINVGAAISTVATIGAHGSPVNSFFKGYLCELIVYNRALSTGERQYNERYLKRKWGTP
jgi:hypothetical protein